MKYTDTIFFAKITSILPKTVILALLSLINTTTIQAQSETQWVDSVFRSLSLEQRVGQLLNVRANQSGKPYDDQIDAYVRLYNIGGVTFFKGDARAQLIQTNRWQQMAQTPLMVAIDGEWGLGMRVNNTISYPLQMTLGAVQDNSLITKMGAQIAEQCKRMGIHVNFAPVADINNNPQNPVIGMRSFGEDPQEVGIKSAAYGLALQQNGIIPSVKHFPGHGNTQTDSHYTLPVVDEPLAELKAGALIPFQQLIDTGIQAVMVGHLYMSALAESHNLSSSLSYNIVTDLLQKQMGFSGLVITDALDMKGATTHVEQQSVSLNALMAGNDILLLPENIPAAVAAIRDAAMRDSLVKKRVEESCRKILKYKYRAGLHQYRPVFPEALMEDLHKTEYKLLVQELFDHAVTLLVNEQAIIPLLAANLNDKKVATLAIGLSETGTFQRSLNTLGLEATHFVLPENLGEQQKNALLKNLESYDLVIVSVQNTNILAARKYGIMADHIAFYNKLSAKTDVILTLFASPYALDFFEKTKKTVAVVLAYQDKVEAQQSAAKAIMGKLSFGGKLPVNVNANYRLGQGILLAPYVSQSSLIQGFIENKYTRKIDSIARDGISRKAYPGCQIVALHKGVIIYKKNFGYLTYDNIEPVMDNTLYDLASLTKILATVPAVMKLYEDKLLSLNDSLGKFFPYLSKTTKNSIRIEEILTHQSGFDGWIPFYLETISPNGPMLSVYKAIPDIEFPFRVANNLYMNKYFKNRIFQQIADSKLKKKEYRYSDIGYYFMPQIVELITNQAFERYLSTNFYEPMGLTHTLFLPLNRFPPDSIAPTELDMTFRQQLLRGDVHDQGAAMLGGISGHAGLFSTATETAFLMQLFMDGGGFNEIQYLKPETIKHFATARYKKLDNRRGIGFDMPPVDPNFKYRTPGKSASDDSFGHTGFTGTFAWADPEKELVVVFLSNRVHPDSANPQLMKLNIRTKIHELFYKAIENNEHGS
ncbi:MAG: glycoside hydrolase family 3 N-terminal domain-containing protein [Bacteroidales bacterium]|jgi:beta-glucosidase-like glycosyl hydrolase/CubicO group peptidase (beta-lactamase class C family)|nr:glycoside hydrolase family 3 N-terminal domain-containing protein [Bacteroidales bacterium]